MFLICTTSSLAAHQSSGWHGQGPGQVSGLEPAPRLDLTHMETRSLGRGSGSETALIRLGQHLSTNREYT